MLVKNKNKKTIEEIYADSKEMCKEFVHLKRHISLGVSPREEKKLTKEKEKLISTVDFYIERASEPRVVNMQQFSGYSILYKMLQEDYLKIQAMPKGENVIELTHSSIDNTNPYTDELDSWTRLQKEMFDIGLRNGYIKIDADRVTNALLFSCRSGFGKDTQEECIKIIGKDFAVEELNTKAK